MNVLHGILCVMFFLFLNNCCIFVTCMYMKKLNMHMKKKLPKSVKDNFIYSPKTLNQQHYVDSLINNKIDIIVAVGPAGTGKTLFACLKAISDLKDGHIDKVVVTRPVVAVEEEEIGFLPGNINKKMDPWTRPIMDLFMEFFSKIELDSFINSNIIEIAPLAFMRGRTFKNAFIIADEMQNSTPNQMKMLTTRLGVNSKMVITGDLKQTDIENKNGLADLMERINTYNSKNNNTLDSSIKIINFTLDDVERSDIVKTMLKLYDNPVNNMKDIENKPINKVEHKIMDKIEPKKELFIPSKNNTTVTENKYLDDNNDAALIPKHHMTKNTDIFHSDFY